MNSLSLLNGTRIISNAKITDFRDFDGFQLKIIIHSISMYKLISLKNYKRKRDPNCTHQFRRMCTAAQ